MNLYKSLSAALTLLFAVNSLAGSTNSLSLSILAPNASEVKLCGIAQQPLPMTKNDSGRWCRDISGIDPDYYGYWFEVDGIRTLDPENAYVIRDVSSLMSPLLVEGGDASLYAQKDVPHGDVSFVWIPSATYSAPRRAAVYTPAGYAQDSSRRYPVLYLLHGSGGDEGAWLELGRAAQILDNLVADRRIEPMIVVMPNCNASQTAAPGFTAEGNYPPSFERSQFTGRKLELSFPELVQYIDSAYRTKTDRDSRAVAGLSMGGGYSLRLSALYPELFGYVGLFSAATRWDGKPLPPADAPKEAVDALSRQAAMNPYYYIAIGADDYLYDWNKDFRSLLDSVGMKYDYIESNGGHTWSNWRHYLVDILPRFFRK